MFPKKIYFKKKIRQSRSYKSNNYEYNKNKKPINFFHLFFLGLLNFVSSFIKSIDVGITLSPITPTEPAHFG